MSEQSVILTERAAQQLKAIGAAENAERMLRITVEGGGCSGFQYTFDLVEGSQPDDMVIERTGAKLLIDPLSLPFLAGSEIDFVDNLLGSSFMVKNPNASSSCGCGTSFSI